MIWYPYEQMKTMRDPYKIVDASGVYIYTEDAKLIDSVSSWWSTIHGYRNPEITEAIKKQADIFSHVMLGGLTHEPVQKLSKKLAEFLPGDLDYCFFSDSGSVAVEVALKMALQYYVNKGDLKRTKIMGLTHAYHGDTFKTMEAGDDEDYHFILEVYGENKEFEVIICKIKGFLAELKYYRDKMSYTSVDNIIAEIIDGKYVINYKPKNKLPVSEWLKLQKRFKHLFKEGNEWMIEELQKEVDERWERLLALEKMTNEDIIKAIGAKAEMHFIFEDGTTI